MLIESNIVKEFKGTYNSHEVYEIAPIAVTPFKKSEVLLSVLCDDKDFAENNGFHIITDNTWEKLVDKEEISSLKLVSTDISTGKSEETAITLEMLLKMYDSVENTEKAIN